jgi:hypothetical protein
MVVKGEVCTGVRCVLQCVQAHILLSGKHTLLSGKQQPTVLLLLNYYY